MSTKEEAEIENRAKFEKHTSELGLLMRCKNNASCTEEKACDSCQKFIQCFRDNFDKRYQQQRAHANENSENYIATRLQELEGNQTTQSRNASPELVHTGQAYRITRGRVKGKGLLKRSCFVNPISNINNFSSYNLLLSLKI